jgi:hypothetical protein
MSESFGTRLRLQRERQQIPLSVIAEETKLSVALLEELERDDLSHWPGGIFRRSFLRDYARIIGLDGDAVVREFLELYPDHVEDVAGAFQRGDGVNGAAGPPTRLRYLFGSALEAFRRLQLGPERPAAAAQTAGGPAPRVHSSPNAPRPEETVAPVVPAETTPAAPPAVSTDDAPQCSAESRQLAMLDATAADRAPVRKPAREVKPAARSSKRRHARVEETIREGAAADGSPAQAAGATPALAPPPGNEPDLQAVADLCTSLGRVVDPQDFEALLARAAGILEAAGIIVWVWNARANGLVPVIAHGYSRDALLRLPAVRADADNATASCFRAAQARVVPRVDRVNGAIAVPLMTPTGCGGVLAVELFRGGEQRSSVLAVAAIIAAQLAALLGGAPIAEAVNT